MCIFITSKIRDNGLVDSFVLNMLVRTDLRSLESGLRDSVFRKPLFFNKNRENMSLC